MLIKDALFVKCDTRAQQMQTALCMIFVAVVLGLVAWWFLNLGVAAFNDGLEYARAHADDDPSRFSGRRSRRMGPMNTATYLGFGAGGFLAFVTLVFGVSGGFHLMRWLGGAGVHKD